MIDANRLLLAWLAAAMLICGGRTALAAAEPSTTQPAIASDIHAPIVIPPPDAAGGGWADGGPTGAYFANPELTGDPAFTRHDVRVDFDWGKYLPVGGSTAEPYKSFPHSKFSVRWTGRVIPRFGESYVFTVKASDGVRLKLKPAGAADWSIAIDKWNQAGTWSTTVGFQAGVQPCDVILEYRDRGDAPAVSLHWSSPSAPDQVVDPVVAQGLNAASWADYCWADEAKTSRWTNRKVTTDADGNPAVENSLILGEGKQGVGGAYDLIFRGQARVGVFGGSNPTFTAGGKTWKGSLPAGAAYDPATDTTHANINPGRKDGLWSLNFLSTTPKGATTQPETGSISDIHVLRPIAPDSDTSHHPDEIVYRPFKAATSPFTCLRWLGVANQRNDGRWSSRTLPDEIVFDRGGTFSDNGGGECWEMLVVLANECGKDLYVALPMMADDSYFQKFAQLIRYGSDGVNPYDREMEHPKWPPLNPNLRVYLEVGNEIWNWGFGSTQQCLAENNRQIKDMTPDGKIVSYDGISNWRRWQALRTVHASNAFRQVLGDAAMGSRMRLLLEYQYNNANDTALISYDFLDKWFNNGDGDHVADPHPIHYYVWGGGGATYYGVGNPVGNQTEVQLPDSSFEKATVPDGSESSSVEGSGWTCTGNAAIYRNFWESVQSFETTRQPPPAKLAAAGYAFRVDKPLFVRELGCFMDPGDSPTDLYLIGPKGVMEHVTVKTLHYKMSNTQGWSYAKVADAPPQLDPGTDYYLLAQAPARLPRFFQHSMIAGPHFSILKSVTVAAGAGADAAKWKIDSAGDGASSYSPVGVLANTAADTKPTELFDPNTGGQGGVIRSGGALSTRITFAKPGHYALTLHAAGIAGYPTKVSMMPFTITIDGKSVDPNGQGDDRISPRDFGIGGFERRINQITEVWGSGVFEVAAPGEVELRIAATGKGPGWTVFDDITVASVDAIMDSGFGAGQAYGQVAQNNYTKQLDGEMSYARSFGLPPVAYEAGWSLGGDFNARPIQGWCKFRDPRATDINNVAESIFTQAGGFMNVWGVYAYWPAYDMANSLTYPLMKSVEDISTRLPAEANNGNVLPMKLLPDGKSMVSWGYIARRANDFPQRGNWNSWLAISPETRTWAASVHAAGAGSWELEIDGVPVGRGSGDGIAYVRLVKGQHGLRFRSLGGGPFKLESIEFAAAPANDAGAAMGAQR